METDEILFKLYCLSGKSKKVFIDHIELGKSSVYDVLKMEDKYHKSQGKNHSMEFIRSWISASRPSESLALLEWLSLVIQLLIDEDDLDLLLAKYESKSSIEPDEIHAQLVNNPGRATSFMPNIFGNLLKFKRATK